MNPSLPDRSPAPAFTLIELLTVIAIIAILMGLLFPAMAIVREQAKRTQAKSDATQIAAAIKAYYTEYGKYPPLGATNNADLTVGDSAAGAKKGNNELFDTLRSIDSSANSKYVLNPRRIVFFEGKAVSNPDVPKGGFLEKSGAGGGTVGAFYDPWGKQYTVIMDTNYDNVIDTPYSDFGGTAKPRVGAGALSMGKDNKLGTDGDKNYRKGSTASDDVVSWQ